MQNEAWRSKIAKRFVIERVLISCCFGQQKSLGKICSLSTNLKSNKMSIFSQMSSIYVLKDWNVDFSRMKLLVNDCWPVCLYSLQSSPYVFFVIYLCSSPFIHILQNPHHYFLFILNQIDLIGKITLPFLSNDLTPPLNRMVPTTWSNLRLLLRKSGETVPTTSISYWEGGQVIWQKR